MEVTGSLPFQKFPVGFGAVEVKKPRGWGVKWDQKRLLEPQGFHLCFPSQGTTVSLSETVQKWREYRRQCQRFLTEAPLLATGESLKHLSSHRLSFINNHHKMVV